MALRSAGVRKRGAAMDVQTLIYSMTGELKSLC